MRREERRARDFTSRRATGNAAQFALRLKEIAPGQKLMLWAHVSHLFYDAEGVNTSVGEILHAALGPKLYTIGAFAESGGTIMLFSDWNNIIGLRARVGSQRGAEAGVGRGCADICFYDLRDAGRGLGPWRSRSGYGLRRIQRR